MISFENQIEIARQVEEVFAYVADLENIPAWNYAIEKTDKVTSGLLGVGQRTYSVVAFLAPLTRSFRSRNTSRASGWLSTGVLVP